MRKLGSATLPLARGEETAMARLASACRVAMGTSAAMMRYEHDWKMAIAIIAAARPKIQIHNGGDSPSLYPGSGIFYLPI